MLLTALTGAAIAMPSYGPIVNAQYKPSKDSAVAKANCALCHLSNTNVKKWNVYGTDLKNAMDKAKTKKLTTEVLASIDALDSDKDGVKNGDELKKGTLPGDPKSK
jgi:hypothetical protein